VLEELGSVVEEPDVVPLDVELPEPALLVVDEDTIVHGNVLAALNPPSLTLAVTTKLPGVVGEPVIHPVAELTLRPGGSAVAP